MSDDSDLKTDLTDIQGIGDATAAKILDTLAEHDDDMGTNMARPESWLVHVNERSTFAQAPPGWQDL